MSNPYFPDENGIFPVLDIFQGCKRPRPEPGDEGPEEVQPGPAGFAFPFGKPKPPEPVQELNECWTGNNYCGTGDPSATVPAGGSTDCWAGNDFCGTGDPTNLTGGPPDVVPGEECWAGNNYCGTGDPEYIPVEEPVVVVSGAATVQRPADLDKDGIPDIFDDDIDGDNISNDIDPEPWVFTTQWTSGNVTLVRPVGGGGAVDVTADPEWWEAVGDYVDGWRPVGGWNPYGTTVLVDESGNTRYVVKPSKEERERMITNEWGIPSIDAYVTDDEKEEILDFVSQLLEDIGDGEDVDLASITIPGEAFAPVGSAADTTRAFIEFGRGNWSEAIFSLMEGNPIASEILGILRPVGITKLFDLADKVPDRVKEKIIDAVQMALGAVKKSPLMPFAVLASVAIDFGRKRWDDAIIGLITFGLGNLAKKILGPLKKKLLPLIEKLLKKKKIKP